MQFSDTFRDFSAFPIFLRKLLSNRKKYQKAVKAPTYSENFRMAIKRLFEGF